MNRPRYTGARIKRVEDPRLLRGRGRFLDDLVLPRMLHAAFVRSPHAHAAVRTLDAAAARAVPGVVAVVGPPDLEARPLSPRLGAAGFVPTAWPALAVEARFCGEAVALVAATSAYAAADGVERVMVDWDVRPARGLRAALAADDVLVRRAHRRGEVDAAFASAPVIVREAFTHDRLTASPLETRGVVADWDGDTLTVWAAASA
jgi:carbon-monoxide dehydrogenase large subunit